MTLRRTSSLLVGEFELKLTARAVRQVPRSIWRQPSAVPLDAGGPDNPFDALPDDTVEDTLFDLFQRAVARDPQGLAILAGDVVVSRKVLLERAAGSRAS